MGGQDCALALTEANLVAIALANASQDDGVAIKKELAFLTIGELDLLFAAPAELEKRAVLSLLWTRDGASAEHIADAHVAASD